MVKDTKNITNQIGKELEKDFDRFEINFDYKKNVAKILLDNLPITEIDKDNTHKILTSSGGLYKSLKTLRELTLFYPNLLKKIQTFIIEEFDKYKPKERSEKEDSNKREEEINVPNTEIKIWEDIEKILNKNLLNATKSFLLKLGSIVGLWYLDFDDSINDFCWIIFIGVRGAGKSVLDNSFLRSEFTLHTDTLTTNSLAPGTPKTDVDKPHSLLDDVRGKALFIHDLTSTLGLSDKDKRKICGDLTNSYGKEPLNKYSPGLGLEPYGAEFTFIGSLTERVYYANKSLLDNMGRFLYFYVKKKDHKLMKKYKPNSKILNEATLGFLTNLRNRFIKEQPKLEISGDADAYLDDLLDIYEEYIQVIRFWNKDMKKHEFYYNLRYDFECPLRRRKQLVILMNAIKFIKDDKTPINRMDVDFIKPLLWGMDKRSERREKIKKMLENNPFLEELNPYVLFDCKDKKDQIPKDVIKIEELEKQTNGFDYEKL